MVVAWKSEWRVDRCWLEHREGCVWWGNGGNVGILRGLHWNPKGALGYNVRVVNSIMKSKGKQSRS